MARFCCEQFERAMTPVCDLHSDPYECPDVLIVHQAEHGYGIPIRDGGSSMIEINFCPWCGSRV